MPRLAGQKNRKALTDREIKALTTTSWVSPNLWCQVTPNGSKSLYAEWMREGARHRLGLGSYPDIITYKQAKDKVTDIMRAVANGENPRGTRIKTFAQAFEEWYKAFKPSWSSAKYARQIESEMRTYALEVLGDLDVARITTSDVHDMLVQEDDDDQPLWLAHHTVAKHVKDNTRLVLGYAGAKGWRDRNQQNPASWEDCLQFLLPSGKAIHTPAPHAALPVAQMAEFMRTLRSLSELRHRCLELLILTATRSQEAHGARWSEFDLDAGLWVIPARRMKRRRDHTVTLPRQAVALLRQLPREEEEVFPGVSGDHLLDAIADVAATLGRDLVDPAQDNRQITVHGFRSTFAGWSGAQRNGYDEQLVKFCLSHRLTDEVYRRYMRHEMVEARQEWMQRWADAIG
jgi:integrase